MTNRLSLCATLIIVLSATTALPDVSTAITMIQKLNLGHVVTIKTNTNAQHFTHEDAAQRDPFTRHAAAMRTSPKGSTHPYTLIINTDWFSLLSPEAQVFWVGHELMHLLLGHDDSNPKHEEFEADIASACLFNCERGAQSILDGAVSGMIKTQKCFHFKEDKPSSHPTFEERIAYLKTLADQAQHWSGDRMALLKEHYFATWKSLNKGITQWQAVL